MNVLVDLLSSKTFLSSILALLFEILNAKYSFGVPSGSSLVIPAAMSLRTLGKEAKKDEPKA